MNFLPGCCFLKCAPSETENSDYRTETLFQGESLFLALNITAHEPRRISGPTALQALNNTVQALVK